MGLKGATALHCAAVRGPNRIARQLIEAVENVDAVTGQQSTPLHLAAKAARVRMTRLLLDRGATANALDETGKTPLDLFRENCRNVPEMERIFRVQQEKAPK